MRIMRIRTRTGRALLAATAAAVAISVGMTTALGSTPVLRSKVTHGGKKTLEAATATLSAAGSPLKVTCPTSGKVTAASSTGVVPSGTQKGHAPLKIGTVTALNLRNCTGPLGKVAVKFSQLPYSLKLNSATNSKGQTDVIVSGVHVSLSMPTCTLTASGSAPGYYSNSKKTLTLTSKLPVKAIAKADLKITTVKGCVGLAPATGHHRSLLGILLGILLGLVIILEVLTILAFFGL